MIRRKHAICAQHGQARHAEASRLPESFAMQRLMPNDGVIHSVTVSRDQVHVAQLVCIALLGASLGLGLVNVSVRLSNPAETTVSAARSLPVQAAATTYPEAPQVQPAQISEQKPVTHTVPAQARAVALAAPAEPSRVPRVSEPATRSTLSASAPLPPPASVDAKRASAAISGSGKPNKRLTPRQFEYGLVVYLRCDGLQHRNNRVPCPRDLKLETRVWQTLRSLPQCREADPGFGQAELRLTLHQKAGTEFVIERAPTGRSLNLRAVSQCTGHGLTKLRSRLRTPIAVVMFRFGLS
jgi:hypothetical protein